LRYLTNAWAFWAWLQGASVLCWGKSRNIVFKLVFFIRRARTNAKNLESCSLPKRFCSFPSEMTKISLQLTYAAWLKLRWKINTEIQPELTHVVFAFVSMVNYCYFFFLVPFKLLKANLNKQGTDLWFFLHRNLRFKFQKEIWNY